MVNSNELEEVFDRGENVAKHWKHRVWHGIANRDELALVHEAACYYYGCDSEQYRFVQHDDGTYSYEAVYGAEGDGRYWLEDWDGTCVLGPNRREIREQLEGRTLRYRIRGKVYTGRALRFNRKTVSISIDGENSWYRIPYGMVLDTIVGGI